MARKMRMSLVQVNHQAKQFAVKLKKAPKRGFSKVGGTQSLDRAWGVLKKWLPKQLNVKNRSTGQSLVNLHLKKKMFQWFWRRNKHDSGFYQINTYVMRFNQCPMGTFLCDLPRKLLDPQGRSCPIDVMKVSMKK